MTQRIIDFPDGFESSTAPVAAGASSAADLGVTPSGNLTSTNAQDAFEELQLDVDSRQLTSQKGAVNGYCPLDASALVPSANLPSYVDDVIEVANFAALPGVGVTGKIYVTLDLNEIYRWSGSNYVEIQDVSTHEALTAAHGATGAVVGTTNTQTLTNKTLTSPTITTPARLDVKQDTKANLVTYASTATNGQLCFATDEKKMYQVVDGALKAVGGGGSGGVNFLPLTTTWSADNTDNVDFEGGIGSWVTYADAAAAIPVDMTGGTATQLTLSRTTTAGEILNGTASAKLVKAAANAQGQGTSCVFNVSPGYSGKRALINIPYRVLSGSVVQGDVKVFIYDVTNGGDPITPYNNDLVGSNGTIEAYYDVPNSTANVQMRVGFHFASTSATAVTFVFDDVNVGPADLAPSSVVTKAQLYTPDASVNAGLGTVSSSSLEHRLVGEFMEITGNITVGTVSVSQARLALPIGTVLDTSGVDKVIGFYFRGATSNSKGGSIIGVDGAGYLCFGDNDGFSGGNINPTSKANGDVVAGNSETIFINAKFKVKNISNATLTQSSTFLISSVLASGTRVTTTPTRLGEWRSMLRNANAATFTDTNGTPGVLPSAENGIRIYAGNAYNAADTNNEPTYYEIFIGQNKNYDVQYFASTGKSGFVDATAYGTTSGSYGYSRFYNPSTGVLTLKPMYGGSGATTHTSGYDGPNSPISDIYFDVIVSESAAPMAVIDPGPSYVVLKTANGFGSSSTRRRRFSTAQKRKHNGYFTDADSATLGHQVTILRDGIYSISYSDNASGGSHFAIAINDVNTTPQSLAANNSLSYQSTVSGSHGASLNWEGPLSAGDIITFASEGTAAGISALVTASVNFIRDNPQ